MTAAGGMNNAIPDDIRDDTHGGPGPIGLANTPGQHILKLSASPDDPSCKKAGLGYTRESGHPGEPTLHLRPWAPAFAGATMKRRG